MRYEQRRTAWIKSLLSATVLATFLCAGCQPFQETGLPASEAETTAGSQETDKTQTTELTKSCTMEQNAEPTDTTVDPETTSARVSKSTGKKTTAAQPLNGIRIQVPYISQKGMLPNGCEAVSATMVLQYWGYSLSAENFVDQYLDCGEMDFSRSPWKGPDPSEAYAGDPRSARYGFGCFAPVIARCMDRVIGEEHEVKNLTGISLDQLCRDYIDQGIPAVVWATINMRPVTKYHKWTSFDGRETYSYPSGEHCLVLVGYDDNRYYFNDPYEGKGLVAYNGSTVRARYSTLGNQAVVILPRPKPTTAAPTLPFTTTETVVTTGSTQATASGGEATRTTAETGSTAVETTSTKRVETIRTTEKPQ